MSQTFASEQPDAPTQADAVINEVPQVEPVDQERLDFERQFEDQDEMTRWPEMGLAILSLVLWFWLFCGGTLIATGPYITAVAEAKSVLEVFQYSAMIIGFWTMSNIGILAVLAALLGAYGQRTKFTNRVPIVESRIVSTHESRGRAELRRIRMHYASAVMRGFGVYMLVLSGLLVMATDALVSPTQGQYVRLAGTISLISFYAGYDPQMLAGLLERVKRFLETE